MTISVVLAWKNHDRAGGNFQRDGGHSSGQKGFRITLINQWMEATTAGNPGALGGAEKGLNGILMVPGKSHLYSAGTHPFPAFALSGYTQLFRRKGRMF
jgi:hypothetical protein